MRTAKDPGCLWLFEITVPTYAKIPVDQIIPDPNQPRTVFDEDDLNELAASIKTQKLQQPIIVNLSHIEGKKGYFIIDKGERRWRVHQRLRYTHIECLVFPVRYDGKLDIRRKLKQAAENGCRVPQTHGELVLLMSQTVEAMAGENGRRYGTTTLAVHTFAETFGKNTQWAQNYLTLTRLHRSILPTLDTKDDDERLDVLTACKLTVAPLDSQSALLQQARERKKKGGHAAMRSFIAEEARRLRSEQGGQVRGRRPHEDKEHLLRLVKILAQKCHNFSGNRKPDAQVEFLEAIVKSLNVHAVDELLGDMRKVLGTIAQISKALEARREHFYQDLKVGRVA